MKNSTAKKLKQVPEGYLIIGVDPHKKKHAVVVMTQGALRILSGSNLREEDFIFSQIDGKPLLSNTVTHNWIKLVRRAGFNGIRLHDERHSHASLMLKQGIHPKIVQERLGHASIQVTLDTYSHVAPGLQEVAAKGFDELVLSNNILTVQ
ncbi:tyrosine-type recombinase/integrase [Chloroflexota bacterium]